MNKKYNIELCRDYATKRNGLCLSEEYSGKKLLWKCNIGHIWGATYNDIFKSKSWCPECSPYKKLNGLKEAQEISDSRKGKCLSKEYKNIESKLLFECDRGHQWYASLGDLKRKNRRGWCPECIGKKKLTIKIAHEEARKKGGKCLSKEYRDNKSFLTWQCEKGHIWDAPLCEIKSHGTWCVYCNRGKITIESLKELAIRRKGLCLSSNYKYGEKLLWKCKKGHEWWANPSNLINGDCWCPECGRLRAAKKMRTSYIAYHWKTGEKLVCVGSYEIREANVATEILNNNNDLILLPANILMM